jgi:predicted ATP-grasp superfamily ATP-dependent carboligase
VRILIYEYATSGGLLDACAEDLGSLRAEGEAMVVAVADEFAALAGVEVHLLRDRRLPPPPLDVHLHRVARAEDELTMLSALVACCDATLVIAPEVDDILLARARLVEEVGGRLLSPRSEVIDLCSDKLRTADCLRARGLPVPDSFEIRLDRCGAGPPHSIEFPAILKRIDGAGSLGTRRVEHADVLIEPGPGRWMLQNLVPGVPASVAILCGPRGHAVLPPFVQHLDQESFSYLGGERLMDPVLVGRARAWATKSVELLPQPVGYLGIDLVLGADPSGRDDAIMEVNPRLTTSFVGLRQVARTNLAEAMLAIADGTLLYPEFTQEPVSFSANGRVTLH